MSQFRKRISYLFFKDFFDFQISEYCKERPTYKGLYIYAVDGDELPLPVSDDVLQDYKGRLIPNNKETYLPRMYVTHAVDVISGVTRAFSFSTKNNEQENAQLMASEAEENSLSIYDRLHFCKSLVIAHSLAGNYFLVRCKGSSFKEITRLRESHRRTGTVTVDGLEARLIKIKNPKTKSDDIFATNLPKVFLNNKDLRYLYSYRWEVETSFRDFTSTMKAEQWHSKFINGILQELYATLWLINCAKIEIARNLDVKNTFMETRYKKSNFKLVVDYISENFQLVFTKAIKTFFRQLKYIIKKSIEKRSHLKRSNPRRLRKRPSRHYCAATVERRS